MTKECGNKKKWSIGMLLIILGVMVVVGCLILAYPFSLLGPVIVTQDEIVLISGDRHSIVRTTMSGGATVGFYYTYYLDDIDESNKLMTTKKSNVKNFHWVDAETVDIDVFDYDEVMIRDPCPPTVTVHRYANKLRITVK